MLLSDEIREEAIEMDKILQKYLKEYFSQVPEKEIAAAETVEEEDVDAVDETKVEAALSRYSRSKSKLPELDEEVVEEDDNQEAPPF